MIYLIAYAVFCIAFAWLNSFLIEKKNLHIYHGINGGIHIIAAIAGYYYWGWQIGISILFVARLFFDVTLNLFRNKAIDYISPEVMRYKKIKEAIKKGKTIDFIEYRIFRKDGISPKILYLFIIIVLVCLQMLK